MWNFNKNKIYKQSLKNKEKIAIKQNKEDYKKYKKLIKIIKKAIKEESKKGKFELTVVYLKTAYSKEILEKVANYFESKNFIVKLEEERTSYFYETRIILSIYWEENKKEEF